MPLAEDLLTNVDNILSTSFSTREGRTIPSSEDVTLKDGAVQLEAVFLYADLAGSAKLASACPWDTTAKIIRSFLDCSTRLIRARGGEVRSFDGDRVMGVFIGDGMNTRAAECGREINYAVAQILDPKAKARFKSIRDNNIDIRHAVGIDRGIVRAVRAGIRNSNDLVWIGKAPSLAAKLSDCRESPYHTFITKRVYDQLSTDAKVSQGKDMWESRSFTFAGAAEPVYRSSWTRRP